MRSACAVFLAILLATAAHAQSDTPRAIVNLEGPIAAAQVDMLMYALEPTLEHQNDAVETRAWAKKRLEPALKDALAFAAGKPVAADAIRAYHAAAMAYLDAAVPTPTPEAQATALRLKGDMEAKEKSMHESLRAAGLWK